MTGVSYMLATGSLQHMILVTYNMTDNASTPTINHDINVCDNTNEYISCAFSGNLSAVDESESVNKQSISTLSVIKGWLNDVRLLGAAYLARGENDPKDNLEVESQHDGHSHEKIGGVTNYGSSTSKTQNVEETDVGNQYHGARGASGSPSIDPQTEGVSQFDGETAEQVKERNSMNDITLPITTQQNESTSARDIFTPRGKVSTCMLQTNAVDNEIE